MVLLLIVGIVVILVVVHWWRKNSTGTRTADVAGRDRNALELLTLSSVSNKGK